MLVFSKRYKLAISIWMELQVRQEGNAEENSHETGEILPAFFILMGQVADIQFCPKVTVAGRYAMRSHQDGTRPIYSTLGC